MNAQDTPSFVIESGIDIPARVLMPTGPRQSKYPIDQMQEGQAFAVPVADEKEARRKQSQFSSLAKTRKVRLITRFFAEGDESPFETVPAPCLGVWHGGEPDPNSPKRRRKPKADTQNAQVQQTQVQDEEEEEGTITL